MAILLPIGWPDVQVAGSGALENDAHAEIRAREQRGSVEAAKIARAQSPAKVIEQRHFEKSSSGVTPELSEADRAVVEAKLKTLQSQVAELKAELGTAN